MSDSGARPGEPEPGSILLVGSDAEHGRSLENALGEHGRDVRFASDAAAALEAIAAAPPDLIVLDLVLPDADGRTLLAEWRSMAATASIPVVVVTVGATHELRNQCLALGAAELLAKPTDVAALSEVVGRLLSAPASQPDPEIDTLTGVASRAALCRAYRQLSGSLVPKALLAITLIDIDHFRAVNDSCDRDTGDTVLRGVADLLRMSTAEGQVVGRWQGDQFIAMLPGVEEEEAAHWLGRCLEALREHSFASTQGASFGVTFSAGVVTAQPGASLEDTIGEARGRLYLAKHGGRERVVFGGSDVAGSAVTILLATADDDLTTAVRNALEPRGFEVRCCPDGPQAVDTAREERIGLFLVEVDAPESDGFELLALLRGDADYAHAPVVALTRVGNEEALERAMALGANDYLVKPISHHELLAHVQHLLSRWVEGRLHELQASKLYARGVELLHQVFDRVRAGEPLPVKDLSVLTLRIVEDLTTRPARLLGQVMNPTVPYDDYLAQHSLNSAILATIVGQEIGFEGDDLDWLCLAALLHEVGCVRLPEGLLQKTGELDDEERAVLRRRPEYSHEIINELAPEYSEAAKIALQVHERPDGSGYPAGLSGEEISLEAQIVGAVEVFEALTHSRPYRDDPQAASEALKYLLDAANTQFLDRVLKALIAKIGLYPVGSYVELSTGEVALVLEHRAQNPMRPVLAVVTDRSGSPLEALRVTDPALNPQVSIRRSVAPPLAIP